MDKIIHSGEGWRLGWDLSRDRFPGMIGGQDWAFELTQEELDDFCRLLQQLADTMEMMQQELMDSESISCEAESDLLWLEAVGYPQAYEVRVILNTGRQCEGNWPASVIPSLLDAVQRLKVF